MGLDGLIAGGGDGSLRGGAQARGGGAGGGGSPGAAVTGGGELAAWGLGPGGGEGSTPPPGAGTLPLSARREGGWPRAGLPGEGALRGLRSEPRPVAREGRLSAGPTEALERVGVAAVRLKMLEEALMRGVIMGQGQRDDLIGRLEDVGGALDAEVEARRLLEERKEKEGHLAESGALLAIEEEKRRRKETHEGIIRVARAQLEAFRPVTVASMSPVHGIVHNATQSELRALSRAIDTELEALPGKERALISSFNAAAAALQDKVSSERRRRQDDHALLMQNMSSTSQEILDALKVERRTREGTEEMLLGLLEGAVANVQNSLT